MSNQKRQARQQRAISRLDRKIDQLTKFHKTDDPNVQRMLAEKEMTRANTSRNLSKKV